jgi:hypothetical protein
MSEASRATVVNKIILDKQKQRAEHIRIAECKRHAEVTRLILLQRLGLSDE